LVTAKREVSIELRILQGAPGGGSACCLARRIGHAERLTHRADEPALQVRIGSSENGHTKRFQLQSG